ncbi:MAG: aspartate-semialdehyde dehydrogenase [Ignavibacteria bacterium]|nr:aspartate-semialdehyde dehydrogenase [Ignavibacteria bacterium]
MTLYDVAVVGATGLVGRKILQILEERNFPVDRVIPIASAKSLGTMIPFKEHQRAVVELNETAFVHAEIVFFAAGGEVSRKWAPIAARHCDIVIDNSSEFRMDPHVPLVVPEVNPRAIFTYKSKIVANPNCSTIQMVLPLKPLHDAYRIKRIVVSTYQAVSGAGQRGLTQLAHELARQPVDRPVFPHPIASNALPHIAVFYSDGYSKEEYKMIEETRKILGDPAMKIAPTCVRVPVANCHSESVNIEFEKPFDLRAARDLIAAAPGVALYDDPGNNVYPLATVVDGKDEVYVGRVRRDESVPNGLAMWIVADNLRKGAATNAVQIAEAWIKGPDTFKVAR